MVELIVQAITQDIGAINFDQLRFKSCGNWVVVLELCADTKTNEARKVFDSRFAEYRGDRFRVIAIYKKSPIVEKITEIKNTFYIEQITYKVGEIVIADSFDENINEVCSHGIHYFKSIYPSIILEIPENYTGFCIKYNDDGIKLKEGNYKNSKEEGKWILYYETGDKLGEGNYINGNREGKWIFYNKTGGKQGEGNFVNDKYENKWIYYYETGEIKKIISYENDIMLPIE